MQKRKGETGKCDAEEKGRDRQENVMQKRKGETGKCDAEEKGRDGKM